MRWTAIGSDLFCPVAVCQRPGEIALFARGASGELFHKEWQDGGWGEVQSLGAPVARLGGSAGTVPAAWQLAACSGDPKSIHLFAGSPDGHLLQMVGSRGEWGAFECLGAPAKVSGGIAIPLGLDGALAASCTGSNRVDVFAVSLAGELLHTSWDGKDWSGFESLGTAVMQQGGSQQSVPLLGSLAACRCGAQGIGIFVRGTLGDLMMKWWNGKDWSEFASLGWPHVPDQTYPAVTVAAPLTGPPAACSWGPERIDVFARGSIGEVLHKWWDGKAWSDFESLGMPVTADARPEPLPSTGAIAACSWGVGRLDVFTRAVGGNLYHAWWDGSWNHDSERPPVANRSGTPRLVERGYPGSTE